MLMGTTTHMTKSAVVIRLEGEPIATGIANVAVSAADFYGDNTDSEITDVRIDELFLTQEHPQFERWNALVGRTVSPEEVWGAKNK